MQTSPSDIQTRATRLQNTLHGEGDLPPGYSLTDLIAIRREDVAQQLESNPDRVWVKVPSGSELAIPADIAQAFLNVVTSPRYFAY